MAIRLVTVIDNAQANRAVLTYTGSVAEGETEEFGVLTFVLLGDGDPEPAGDDVRSLDYPRTEVRVQTDANNHLSLHVSESQTATPDEPRTYCVGNCEPYQKVCPPNHVASCDQGPPMQCTPSETGGGC